MVCFTSSELRLHRAWPSNFFYAYIYIHKYQIHLPKAAWSLKTRALTEQVRVDYLEIFEDGIAEAVFNEDTIATTAKPGTSLRVATARPSASRDGPSPAIRYFNQVS